MSFVGPPQIDPDEIELREKIGEGCFGSVHRGRCRAIDVAIKIPKKQEMTADQLDAFCKEVEIMSNINAPNINLFLGACTVPGNIMIVTELLEGDMESLVRDTGNNLALYDRLKMARDAAQGIAWLHGSNPVIIHRDIKTSNFLYDKNRKIKVCDFGFSQLYQRGKKIVDEEGAKGTPLYMAPEVMLGDEFNEKADVYSFGIVLWETLTRKEPFSHHSDFDEFVEAICVKLERPPIPQECPPTLKNLIVRCWSPNPNDRPSFPEIVDSLEEILIDIAVEDDFGRKLWRNYFFRQEFVSWGDEFVPVFAQVTGTKFPNPATNEEAYMAKLRETQDSLEYKCLEALLADKGDNQNQRVVSLVKFGQVVGWLGPIKDKSGFNFLKRVVEILKQPWFHGSLDYNEAVHKLQNKQSGTYLVRFSSRDYPCCYTLSKVDGKKIVHSRIQHKLGGDFSLGKDKSETLIALIQKLFTDSAPVPESPFGYLFVNQNEWKDDLYE